MLVMRIGTILSPLSFEEAPGPLGGCTKIHSIAGLLRANVALITTCPFRGGWSATIWR
jgi:hypothetical protein